MWRSPDSHLMGVRMNKNIMERFSKGLANFSFSDYYGLQSPGLTCYLNSVLQVLFMTIDFREAVKSMNSTNVDVQLAKLFTALEKKVTRTHDLIRSLSINNVYEQRDAAEYLEKILSLTSPQASKIFRGELNHTTTCMRCNDKSDSRCPFWTLPLSMEDSPHKVFDVEQGLKAFFKVQRVCGDNQMFCTRCSGKEDANTKCDMTQSPDVLTLLLKRFTFDYKQRCYVKLHCQALVPQTLHMERCTYALHAVVNHFGGLTGGHYTADIRSFETNWWYCFNDGVVKRVKSDYSEAGRDSLRSCTAYLLMYRKGKESEQTTDCDLSRSSDEAPPTPRHQLKYEDHKAEEALPSVHSSPVKRHQDTAEWLCASPLPSVRTNGHKSGGDMKELLYGVPTTEYGVPTKETEALRPRERGRCNSWTGRQVSDHKLAPTQPRGRSRDRGTVKKCDDKVKKPWRY